MGLYRLPPPPPTVRWPLNYCTVVVLGWLVGVRSRNILCMAAAGWKVTQDGIAPPPPPPRILLSLLKVNAEHGCKIALSPQRYPARSCCIAGTITNSAHDAQVLAGLQQVPPCPCQAFSASDDFRFYDNHHLTLRGEPHHYSGVCTKPFLRYFMVSSFWTLVGVVVLSCCCMWSGSYHSIPAGCCSIYIGVQWWT